MIATTLSALALSLQSAPETAALEELRRPTTWITEYPIIIQPLVQDYRRCLNYADRRFRGEADFEAQHAADLPRCEKLKAKLVAKSEEALSHGRWSEVLAPERAGDVFRTVAQVHVERGRAFDRQLMSIYYVQQAREVPTDLMNEEVPTNAQN
ncbi:hypothetical protein [Altererythrobacter sp. GH1-8]|uniref:hypothetical protein n=1 Tax=Altererythrobacter sp. GH1-8 TaxID=3349333 RepID=UPI00374D302C